MLSQNVTFIMYVVTPSIFASTFIHFWC